MPRLQVAGVLIALLGGCREIQHRAQPFDRSGRDLGPLALFEVEWRVERVGPRFWEYRPREPAQPAVDPDTGRVVALTRDGRVRGLSREGRVEWEFKTEDPFVAGATVHEGM